MWPDTITYRGVKIDVHPEFEHVYVGITTHGYPCYLRSNFFSTGYIVIPQSVVDEYLKESEDNNDDGEDCDVVGGITFNGHELPIPEIDVKDCCVYGFDTGHSICPRNASIKYMIDEICKLDDWAYTKFYEKKSVHESPFELTRLVKLSTEDHLSYSLRVLEEQARKIGLPKVSEEISRPDLYIQEVIKRIQIGQTGDTGVTNYTDQLIILIKTLLPWTQSQLETTKETSE